MQQLTFRKVKKTKIERALKAVSEVSIKLSHDDLNHVVALTQAQINKMAKAYENGKGVTIKMSQTQIEYNKKVEGGFLVSKLLPSLATGALAGIGTAAGSILVHKLSGGTIYVKRGGRDYKICPVRTRSLSETMDGNRVAWYRRRSLYENWFWPVYENG